MEEIDRKIDEMPELDLRDPKSRKKSSVDIDDLVKSLDMEARMIAAFEALKKPDDEPTDPDGHADQETTDAPKDN